MRLYFSNWASSRLNLLGRRLNCLFWMLNINNIITHLLFCYFYLLHLSMSSSFTYNASIYFFISSLLCNQILYRAYCSSLVYVNMYVSLKFRALYFFYLHATITRIKKKETSAHDVLVYRLTKTNKQYNKSKNQIKFMKISFVCNGWNVCSSCKKVMIGRENLNMSFRWS